MKLFSAEHIFDHSWFSVSTASWRKYPNPFNPAIASIDILDRKITEDGKLLTRRLICTDFKLPNWFKKIVGDHKAYCVEESVVDPVAQTHIMRSKNFTLNQFLTIEEHMNYRMCPTDPSKTRLTQEARISVSMKFSDYLEQQVANNMSANAKKGRDAIEYVIAKLEAEVRELAEGIIQSAPHAECQSEKS
eukprot:m.16969 g.16969  ORF g.16969 m.16969 type:complete len:190 (-) comp7006_c0_seq1:29-598(-)